MRQLAPLGVALSAAVGFGALGAFMLPAEHGPLVFGLVFSVATLLWWALPRVARSSPSPTSREGRGDDRQSVGVYRNFRYNLRNAESYRFALSSVGAGAWVWDFDSDTVHLCPKSAEIIGRPDMALNQRASFLSDLLDGAGRLQLARAVEASKRDGASRAFDAMVRVPDDGDKRVTISVGPLDGGRQSDAVGGAFLDVAQFERIDWERSRQRANLAAVLENTEDMIFAFDREFRLLMLNSSFCKNALAAYGVRLSTGDDLLEKSPEKVRELWRPRYKRALGGEAFALDEVFDVRGKRFYFEVSLNPIREGGTVIGAAVFVRNITERKRQERDWKRAKDKAEEADRLKSAFLANMSHEIRTPLNAIMGFTQLLQDEDMEEGERHRFAEVILSNGRHLLRILDDIIDIAQIESNQIRMEPAPCDLSLLLGEAYSVFSEQARNRNSRLEVRVDNDLDAHDVVVVDETRLKQVLYNLLSNAVKFAGFGSIRFGYRKRADQLIEFHVADTGPGVSEVSKATIFDRFRQGEDHIGRSSEGVGLGLSICRGLARLLGGEIWVEDNEPTGAVFKFTIREQDFQPVGPETSEREGPAPASGAGRARSGEEHAVLVAEDDDTNFMVIEEFLKQQALTVVRARNGEEAIELARRDGRIWLVVMDLSMPVLNGVDATRRIKAIRPDLPVIAHTAHAMDRDLARAREAGCSDCLVKPIDIEDLRALLDKHRA